MGVAGVAAGAVEQEAAAAAVFDGETEEERHDEVEPSAGEGAAEPAETNRRNGTEEGAVAGRNSSSRVGYIAMGSAHTQIHSAPAGAGEWHGGEVAEVAEVAEEQHSAGSRTARCSSMVAEISAWVGVCRCVDGMAHRARLAATRMQCG